MSSVWNVWPSTEVDEVTYFIDACHSIIRHLLLDEVRLKSIVAEQIKCFFFRKFESLEVVFGFDNLFY